MIRIKDELNIKTMRVRLLRIRLSFTNTISLSMKKDMKIEDLTFFMVICLKGFSVERKLVPNSPSNIFLCHPLLI